MIATVFVTGNTPWKSSSVRAALSRKRDVFKPIPIDELKKLVREEDFVVDYYIRYYFDRVFEVK